MDKEKTKLLSSLALGQAICLLNEIGKQIELKSPNHEHVKNCAQTTQDLFYTKDYIHDIEMDLRAANMQNLQYFRLLEEQRIEIEKLKAQNKELMDLI